MDVRFELRWRHAAAGAGDDGGAGGGDTVLASVTHHFVRDAANPYVAIAFAADLDGVQRVTPQSGDELVLRVTPTAGDPGAVYIPNGDGANSHGRIPHLDLP